MNEIKKSEILTESGTNELEIIEFHLHKVLPNGGHKVCHYGINVAKVREVIRCPKPQITPMPSGIWLGCFRCEKS